jgi:hypothetical protein
MNETEKVPRNIGALIVSPKAYATQKELMAGFRWLRHNNRLHECGIVEIDAGDARANDQDFKMLSRLRGGSGAGCCDYVHESGSDWQLVTGRL